MSSAFSSSPLQHQKTCIISAAKIIGDKWTPMLLFALADQPRRFSELQMESGGINPRTLSARLAGLESAEIISRIVRPYAPPHVEYALTDKGRDLLPVVSSMIVWSEKYPMPETD